MRKRKRRPPAACETMTLPGACRVLGISTTTATKILRETPSDLPPIFWIGGRRYLLRRQLHAWLLEKGRSAG